MKYLIQYNQLIIIIIIIALHLMQEFNFLSKTFNDQIFQLKYRKMYGTNVQTYTYTTKCEEDPSL